MNKTLTFFLLIIMGFYSAQLIAQKTIKLDPNETKLLANNTLWTLNATCTIHNNHHNASKIKINVLKNNGIVNGKSLSAGQGTLVQVGDNNSVSVSADSGTQINLINLGTDELLANCSS